MSHLSAPHFRDEAAFQFLEEALGRTAGMPALWRHGADHGGEGRPDRASPLRAL